jgi:hypothetical protein
MSVSQDWAGHAYDCTHNWINLGSVSINLGSISVSSRSISDFIPGRSRILSNHVPELVIAGHVVDIGVLCQVLLRSKPTLLQTRTRLMTAGELAPGTRSRLAGQEAWNHVTPTQMPATRCSTLSFASRSQVREGHALASRLEYRNVSASGVWLGWSGHGTKAWPGTTVLRGKFQVKMYAPESWAGSPSSSSLSRMLFSDGTVPSHHSTIRR